MFVGVLAYVGDASMVLLMLVVMVMVAFIDGGLFLLVAMLVAITVVLVVGLDQVQ